MSRDDLRDAFVERLRQQLGDASSDSLVSLLVWTMEQKGRTDFVDLATELGHRIEAHAADAVFAALTSVGCRPNKGTCKSCERPMIWAETMSGKVNPLDRVGTSHFATCPHAARHRKPQREVRDPSEPRSQ